VLAALTSISGVSLAQAPAADAAGPPDKQAEPYQELPPYHHSMFTWEHAVTGQTLGVGITPQSSDPTYTMGLVAKTRYYLLDDTPVGRHFSVRLEGGLYREITNSDTTTKRGEWGFSDIDLAAVWVRRFYGPADLDGAAYEVRPLTLTLPTSKVSYESGRYLAPGVLFGLWNTRPVLQGQLPFEVLTQIRLSAGYKRWFARATVPTNPSFDRVRLTPDGRSLPSDVLSGSSLVRDQLDFAARLRLVFGDEQVIWTTDLGFSPSWKYAVPDKTPICGVVLTGCVDVPVSADDSRYMVMTQLNTEVSIALPKGFSVELGYGNVANQLGPDGRRRGMFYSPAAVFYTSLSFQPHELAPPPKKVAAHSGAPRL
jgi:hypothetical protein